MSVLGGSSAKVGLSAKFGVAVFKASILDLLWGVHWPKKVHLPNMNTLLNLLLLHRRSFHTGIQGISALLPGGSICQSLFVCQVLCTGIQGIYALLRGVHLPKYVCLPSFVYQYSRHLCSITRGVHWPKKVCLPNMNTLLNLLLLHRSFCTGIQSISALLPGGVHLPKYVCLPSFVDQYSRHLCSINGGSIGQSRFVCQVLCTGIQGIYALLPRGVHWPKKVHLPNMNTLLNLLLLHRSFCTGIQSISALLPGGSICQSMFVCQVLCTSIQGIYALLPRGSISQSRFVCQVWCTSIQGIYSQFHWGSIGQRRFVCQI